MNKRMQTMVDRFYDLIEKDCDNYDIEYINDLFVEIIRENVYTSKDSINNLISSLEKIRNYIEENEL